MVKTKQTSTNTQLQDMCTLQSQRWPWILESNVKPSVQQLKLGPNCVVQKNNDHKHQQTYNRTSTKGLRCCKWHSQISDLNSTKNIWQDFKSCAERNDHGPQWTQERTWSKFFNRNINDWHRYWIRASG